MKIVLDVPEFTVERLRGTGQYLEVMVTFDRTTASRPVAIQVQSTTGAVLSAWWRRKTRVPEHIASVDVLVPGGRFKIPIGGLEETFVSD